MEIPIQVAVRIYPKARDANSVVEIVPPTNSPIQEVPTFTSHLVQVGPHSFPVSHAFAEDCTQNDIYLKTVYPLINLFFEGFDASFVMYGQCGQGKTYTLFGPGFDCAYGEPEQGLIQRCIRDIFSHLSVQSERHYGLSIAWTEICGENVRDLLDAGSVQCMTIVEAFQWLHVGMRHRTKEQAHSLFTLTLDQNWISANGLIQHKLSTLSFCDLCGSDRMYVLNSVNQHLSVPKDLGLQSLERIVNGLTDTSIMYNNSIQYTETTLTTILKDSFGGRAQTMMILCLSSLEEDINETIGNLQFAFKAQCVRNYVVMNTYSDNNTPVSVDTVHDVDQVDTLGLQFAASQWLKLVSNAEGLFSKLVGSKNLSEQDREQIKEWMFLKAECEECLSSGELNIVGQRHLGPIQEADEQDETSENETSCQQNSDNESDSECQRPDLQEKINRLMDELRAKTNNMIKEKYKDFLKNQPKAVFDSNENFCLETRKQSQGESNNGRRKSIQPGQSLSSAEIAMLHRVASREHVDTRSNSAFLNSSSEISTLRTNSNPVEIIQVKIRKIETDIEASQRQIKELEHTITLKQKLISDLIKNNDTRTTAKHRFNKKKNKLEAEYEKTKKQLSKAVANGRDKSEVDRLKAVTSHIEQRLSDLASIKHIAGESGQKVKKLQQSLQESRKQLELLQKSIKKEKKAKDLLEDELKSEKSKESKNTGLNLEKGKNIREVTARISHLDHVLKEKSKNLEHHHDGGEKDSLRHEIRNLRRTRDHLLDQRFALDKKLKKDKILSHTEERKLLECDEAIEAIDAAIEFKNELICGRKSIDTNEKLQKEKGEQMLMARLNKLSVEEMRTLLYKYFQKVIDLRESSRKLEIQLMSLERERDAWEWRERVLSNAVRQARLEGERHAVLLQRQHETKLTLMLRHLAEETSTNSSLTDRFIPHQPSHYADSDLELDIYKPGTSKHLIKAKHADMDLCPLPMEGQLSKYKPLDKIKEKDRESKNKLFAKLQVLTRYHGGDKRKIHDSTIPEHNLKQLQTSSLPLTKVTREKNKIIIQQDTFKKN